MEKHIILKVFATKPFMKKFAYNFSAMTTKQLVREKTTFPVSSTNKI